jgi:hypothetical protein
MTHDDGKLIEEARSSFEKTRSKNPTNCKEASGATQW